MASAKSRRQHGGIAKRPKGLLITIFVNWLVKPFGMAFLAWVFLQNVFAAWIEPEMAKNYTAGLIILAAAPCTAMVFVWDSTRVRSVRGGLEGGSGVGGTRCFG